MPKAWVELPFDQYESFWDPVDRDFKFKASTTEFPGFAEPDESTTFHIGHIYGEPSRHSKLLLDLSERFVRAFQECTKRDGYLNVLNWQHPSYRYWPHIPFNFESEEEWPIPILPNGDYYLFLDPSHAFGVLGHPWEMTMCVFGPRLLEAIESDPPKIFDRPIRVGGKVL